MMKFIATMLAIAAASGAANACAQAADPGRTEFAPTKGVQAVLTVKVQEVELNIEGPGVQVAETIAVETEKKLRVKVEDYNFDGYKDFSISHTDDGMGTYEISLVYVYSPKEKKFVPLAPRCGDEFINLVVNKSRKTLTNSYFVDNQFRTCKAKY
ncbi:XAC2610-related protein [Pseudoduganella sp. HUAS MS19]